MLKFQKGEAFPLPPVTEEGVTFSVEPYTMLLIYRFRHPSEEERRAFREGKVSFGIASLRNTLFVLSKFGSLAWMDTPYSTHLSQTVKSFPALQPGQGYAIDAFLVDCADNTLVEHRLLHLETAAAEKVRDLILEEQERTGFTLENFRRSVEEVYRGYPPRELVKIAELVTKLR